MADYAEAEWAQQTPLLLPTLFFLAPDAFPSLATVSATRSASSSGSKCALTPFHISVHYFSANWFQSASVAHSLVRRHVQRTVA